MRRADLFGEARRWPCRGDARRSAMSAAIEGLRRLAGGHVTSRSRSSSMSRPLTQVLPTSVAVPATTIRRRGRNDRGMAADERTAPPSSVSRWRDGRRGRRGPPGRRSARWPDATPRCARRPVAAPRQHLGPHRPVRLVAATRAGSSRSSRASASVGSPDSAIAAAAPPPRRSTARDDQEPRYSSTIGCPVGRPGLGRAACTDWIAASIWNRPSRLEGDARRSCDAGLVDQGQRPPRRCPVR